MIVSFIIEWEESNKNNVLLFENVYWIEMILNGGIVAEETIRFATKTSGRNIKELENFYSSWHGLMDGVDLSLYTIETNSTNSTIKIIAENFNIV